MSVLKCENSRQQFTFSQKVIPSQQAHDVEMTSDRRRCDVIVSHRRQFDVVTTSCVCWDEKTVRKRNREKTLRFEYHEG